MNRSAIIFCLSVAITNTANYAMEDSFNTFESSDSKSKANAMCNDVQNLLALVNTLKSQVFGPIHPRNMDLPETQKRILQRRLFDLEPFARACKNNTAESELPKWNAIQSVTEHTLELASTINHLLMEEKR